MMLICQISNMSRIVKSVNKSMNFSIKKILFQRTSCNLQSKKMYTNNNKNKRNQYKFLKLRKCSINHTMLINKFCSSLNNYKEFIPLNWKCNNRTLQMKNLSKDKNNWHYAIRPSKTEYIHYNKLKKISSIK